MLLKIHERRVNNIFNKINNRAKELPLLSLVKKKDIYRNKKLTKNELQITKEFITDILSILENDNDFSIFEKRAKSLELITELINKIK